jgi:hypothetical protein
MAILTKSATLACAVCCSPIPRQLSLTPMRFLATGFEFPSVCLRSTRFVVGNIIEKVSVTMRSILLVVISLVLAGCQHQPPSYSGIADQCTQKYPTDQEFMLMERSTLYTWSKAVKVASDTIALSNAVGRPIEPCTAALMYKREVVEQAMRFH